MDPTPEQRKVVAEYKETFGSNVIKVFPPRKSDGIVRVEAQAQAGLWQWSINPAGELVHASMDMTLFKGDGNAAATRPGALPRNAQDDNDT